MSENLFLSSSSQKCVHRLRYLTMSCSCIIYCLGFPVVLVDCQSVNCLHHNHYFQGYCESDIGLERAGAEMKLCHDCVDTFEV